MKTLAKQFIAFVEVSSLPNPTAELTPENVKILTALIDGFTQEHEIKRPRAYSQIWTPENGMTSGTVDIHFEDGSFLLLNNDSDFEVFPHFEDKSYG